MATKKYLDEQYIYKRIYHFTAITTLKTSIDVEAFAEKTFGCSLSKRPWVKTLNHDENSDWGLLRATYTAPYDFALPFNEDTEPGKEHSYNIHFLIFKLTDSCSYLLIGTPFINLQRFMMKPFLEADSPMRGLSVRYQKLDIASLIELTKRKNYYVKYKLDDECREIAENLNITNIDYQVYGDSKNGKTVGLTGESLSKSDVLERVVKAIQPYKATEFSCKLSYRKRLSIFADRFGRFSMRVSDKGLNMPLVLNVLRCLHTFDVVDQDTKAPIVLSASNTFRDEYLRHN